MKFFTVVEFVPELFVSIFILNLKYVVIFVTKINLFKHQCLL